MILLLLTLLSFQSEERKQYCLADPVTGQVTSTLIRTLEGGVRQVLIDGDWQPEPPPGPQAVDLDWYRSGEPIVRDGIRYLQDGDEWAPGAVGRYLRDAGLYRGAAVMTIWPGGDIDLAVLVHQEGCIFRTYVRDDPKSG